ncbi:hypothetical protein OL229_03380 [Neisseriaceae bacterium JH1-16]|nr:hypothetical protein [Neisseriaceae bacterium JH1-16]
MTAVMVMSMAAGTATAITTWTVAISDHPTIKAARIGTIEATDRSAKSELCENATRRRYNDL